MVTDGIGRLRDQLSHLASLGDDLGSFGIGRSSEFLMCGTFTCCN
jgi:hypothetical protein